MTERVSPPPRHTRTTGGEGGEDAKGHPLPPTPAASLTVLDEEWVRDEVARIECALRHDERAPKEVKAITSCLSKAKNSGGMLDTDTFVKLFYDIQESREGLRCSVPHLRIPGERDIRIRRAPVQLVITIPKPPLRSRTGIVLRIVCWTFVALVLWRVVKEFSKALEVSSRWTCLTQCLAAP